METKHTPGPIVVITTLKRTVTNGFIVRRGDQFNYDLIAVCYTEENANEIRDCIAQAPDLLAKVSEQEKEIAELRKNFIVDVTLDYKNQVSEQSQRITALLQERKELENNITLMMAGDREPDFVYACELILKLLNK